VEDPRVGAWCGSSIIAMKPGEIRYCG